jgi:hypothetical protein
MSYIILNRHCKSEYYLLQHVVWFVIFVVYFDIKVIKRYLARLPRAVDGNRYFSLSERDTSSSNIFQAYG